MRQRLKKFIDDVCGGSQAEFARQAGISKWTLNRVLTGRYARFSVEAAVAVAKATKDAVTFEECLGVPKAKPKRAASSR